MKFAFTKQQFGWVAGLLCGGLTIGLLVGLFIPQTGLRSVAERLLLPPAEAADSHAGHGHGHSEDAHDHGGGGHGAEPGHLDIAKGDLRRMGIDWGRPELDSFTRTVRVPAFVREVPGRSELKVSTPVTGIITQLHVLPGQVVSPGDPVAEIRLTGERLADVQSQVLALLKEEEVAEAELKRLTESARTGGIARKEQLEQEYRLNQLVAKRQARRQELELLGLSTEQVQEVIATKTLIRTFTIKIPEAMDDAVLLPTPIPETPGDNGETEGAPSIQKLPSGTLTGTDNPSPLTVEELLVTVGQTVTVGDSLCEIANHVVLFVEGQAFTADLPTVLELARANTPLSVSLRDVTDPSQNRPGKLRIFYVDNHVDPGEQIFRFSLPFENSILKEFERGDGSTIRSWRYRPGQRGHIELPVEQLDTALIVPSEAVFGDGVRHYVFRVDHSSRTELHLQKTLVTVIGEDSDQMALDPNGELDPDDRIALGGAYLLNTAAEQGEGGGGAHHGHEH